MRTMFWRVPILLLLILPSCGMPDPDTPVSHQPGAPHAPVHPSLWQRLTDRTGEIRGRLVLPDGTPAAEFTLDCKPLFDLPGGRPTVGHASGPAGQFTCGGPPGTYQIEVYSKEGTGIIGMQQVELHARAVVTVDLTIHP